jgi:predicted nucleic acid-binding protein
MKLITIILDTGPLGMVSNPKGSGETLACKQWLRQALSAGYRVVIPEIADYEVRRELLRADRVRGIRRLDELAQTLEYLPLTTAAMRQAAEFWATARKQGTPTAPDKAPDGDVILAAQASLTDPLGGEVVVATTNVSHLSIFVTAREWHEIV